MIHHQHSSSVSTSYEKSFTILTRLDMRGTPKRFGDFAMALTELKGDIPIPTSYREATQDEKYGKQREQAIREELQALISFGTWTLVDCKSVGPGRKAIGCRWVFDLKCNKDRIVQRFKARLDARGFSQKQAVKITVNLLWTANCKLTTYGGQEKKRERTITKHETSPHQVCADYGLNTFP